MPVLRFIRPQFVVTSLAMGTIGALIACSTKSVAKDSSAAAPASSSVLERDTLDLDGDNVPDQLTVVRGDSSVAGKVARVELRMSRAGQRVLGDSTRWDPQPDEFNANGNLVKSRLVYVADFARAGRLLFLFGALRGCCEQSLTIYRLGAKGPEPYFHAPEFFVDRSPVPQAGTVATIAGRRLSAPAALPSSDFVSSVTYAPVVVYRLEETPRIDSAATRALTREELGGFAGFDTRTDVAALRRRDGSKVLWNLTSHHPIP